MWMPSLSDIYLIGFSDSSESNTLGLAMITMQGLGR